MAASKHGPSDPLAGEKEDSDVQLLEILSSSESEDETKPETAVFATDVSGKNEDADENFEREFEEEQELITRATLSSDEGDLKSTVNMLRYCNSFSQAAYQDILPLVVDGRKFLVDGDSLLMLALDSEGLSLEAGSSTLHCVYIVEKFLSLFQSRGLNFVIVFFEIWDQCWLKFPTFYMARTALQLHLMHNQRKVAVLSMKSLWSEDFSNFIQDQRPSFLMTYTSLPKFLAAEWASANEEGKTLVNMFEFVLYSQAVTCDFLCLDVADIPSVHSTAICIMATVHVHLNRLEDIRADIYDRIKAIDLTFFVRTKPENSIDCQEQCVRKYALVNAVSCILKKNSNPDVILVMKIVLLYTTLIEHTPLKWRCFQKVPSLPDGVAIILSDFQTELVNVISTLSNVEEKSKNFRAIGDLWHGRFFLAIFNLVCHMSASKGNVSSSDLGNIIANDYEQLVKKVNEGLNDVQLSPYPIDHICKENCAGHILEKPMKREVEQWKLIPSSCKLTKMFCDDLISSERFSSILTLEEDTTPYLHQSRHWHNTKPITDELERIPDNADATPQYEVKKRYAQNQRNNLARFYTIYGLSLEGRSSVKAIVTANESKTNHNQKKSFEKKKPDKQKPKLSKKDQIIEDNMKRKSEEKKKQIKERLKTFSSNLTVLLQKGDLIAAIERCDVELKRASEFNDFVIEILFMKAKACFELWSEACYKKQKNPDLRGAKDLFLAIREILNISEKSDMPLTVKQKSCVSAWLCNLGFEEVASLWKLPAPIKSSKEKHGVGMNHIEFQMAHLGPDLIRDTGGKPDPRADGFIPDPWQAKLFDIIDNNQSAVVVAPTSSGKTYASYYAMEKVIRESDDGVVVYVCPTKALVNQVYATIYARFKKNLPPGKVLQGTFTRDYRDNVMNCQILTTVPSCLELLLLSPRCHTWAKRLKYVIFDEVHCLAGHSGGLAWENSILLIRCPYLALSATIHQPETFCSWLQKAEDFKKMQAERLGLVGGASNSHKVSLVVHSDRHNHLKKNVLMSDGTIHPVHPYSFLDPVTIEECDGIPHHIALSPDEALELYHAMKAVIPTKVDGNLQPDMYFKELCPAGFISMQSVKQFSEELKKTLQKESVETLIEVLKQLQTVDYSECQTGDEYVFRNISTVLNTLRSNGMLPSLAFTYNRRLVDAMPAKLLRELRDIDDFTEDEDTDIESESESEMSSKKGNKENRRFRAKRYTKKLGILRGPSMLKSEGSVRGEGFTDQKVIEYIEHRLIKMKYKSQDTFPSLLRRGLGRHFGGMNNRERSAVEMLFRMKILNFVSATGTLALGIHMPCKTVVVAGDSPFLNSLEYNQMSGRAGRRGYDKEGHVILFGLNKRKMQTLITGHLPKMTGNFPLSASLVLRLQLLVGDVTFQGKVTDDATNEAIARTSTLLEKSLLYESQPGLKDKMKYYFAFVNQFLIRQGLVSKDGHPHVDAQIITHHHYHEPGNFAFYYLLRSGALEEMCKFKKDGSPTEESIENILIVLNFLFAHLPLSRHLLGRERSNSIVKLPPLPEVAREALIEYNVEVLKIFRHYYTCTTTDLNLQYGEDKNLPFSQLDVHCEKATSTPIEGMLMSSLQNICTINNVCSVFAGLSGITDQFLYNRSGEILHVREDINVKVIPTVELKSQCNAYAYDFYRHGIKQAICRENGLRSGYDFDLLKDFNLTVKAIVTTFSETLGEDSKLMKTLSVISNTFESNFNKAYSIQQKI